MLRTHTCGELSEESLNKEVVLCGWVDARRDHGKIIFSDIRDRYGVTQLVFAGFCSQVAYKEAEKLKNEDVIMVRGKVCPRPKGTINPKIHTGKIEVGVTELTIMSGALDLPFLAEDSVDASEEVRLSYRFLDLRRRPLLQNLKMRHAAMQSVRNFLNTKDFLE